MTFLFLFLVISANAQLVINEVCSKNTTIIEDEFGETSLGFLMGKSKLAPLKGHTIPSLELCVAVLATELEEAVCDYLKIPQDRFHYYTDSRIVLGYICNKTRRFFVYVTNPVEKIL